MSAPTDRTVYPVRLMLTIAGDERGTHRFHLRVEGPSGALGWVGGADVMQPWLRSACSCGWQAGDDKRVTLEENAHWQWIQHTQSDDD